MSSNEARLVRLDLKTNSRKTMADEGKTFHLAPKVLVLPSFYVIKKLEVHPKRKWTIFLMFRQRLGSFREDRWDFCQPQLSSKLRLFTVLEWFHHIMPKLFLDLSYVRPLRGEIIKARLNWQILLGFLVQFIVDIINFQSLVEWCSLAI